MGARVHQLHRLWKARKSDKCLHWPTSRGQDFKKKFQGATRDSKRGKKYNRNKHSKLPKAKRGSRGKYKKGKRVSTKGATPTPREDARKHRQKQGESKETGRIHDK